MNELMVTVTASNVDNATITLDGIAVKEDDVVMNFKQVLKNNGKLIGEINANALPFLLVNIIENSNYRVELCFTKNEIRKPESPFSFIIFDPINVKY